MLLCGLNQRRDVGVLGGIVHAEIRLRFVQGNHQTCDTVTMARCQFIAEA